VTRGSPSTASLLVVARAAVVSDLRPTLAPLAKKALLAQLVAGLSHAVLAGGAAAAVRAFVGGDATVPPHPLPPLLVAGAGALCKLFATALAVHRERTFGVAAETELRVRLFRGGLQALREGEITAERLAAMLVEEPRLLVAEAYLPGLLVPRRLAALVPLLLVGGLFFPRAVPLAVLPVAMLVGVVALFRRVVRRRAEDAAIVRNNRLEATLDRARHALLFAAYGRTSEAEQAFRKDGDRLAAAEGGVDAIAAALSGANEFLAIVGVAAFAGVAGGAAVRGLLPALVPFVLAYRPIKELAETRLDLARGRLRAERLRPWLSRAAAFVTPVDDATSVVQSSLVLQEIRPMHARFSPVSGVIPFGRVVALCGPTGIGKSSLFAQLLGFAPGLGRASYGAMGAPQAAVFAWMPQDGAVFAGSTAENLFDETWPNAVPRPEGLALEAAIGAGGRALSGGERQWIAFARAVASRAPVLLLDEPTAAMDPRAEQAFVDVVAALRGTRTIVLITHRAATAAVADEVWNLRAEPENRGDALLNGGG
jgi:ABC-type transport system involved in cytochrome bd biosynthesis fused ATPase/permease subunit